MNNPGFHAVALGSMESESRVPGRYRQTKENEVRRNGRCEVGASHSPLEAGEPLLPEPSGGKGTPSHRTVVGNPDEGIVPRQTGHRNCHG
jgi:hypothetical protein